MRLRTRGAARGDPSFRSNFGYKTMWLNHGACALMALALVASESDQHVETWALVPVDTDPREGDAEAEDAVQIRHFVDGAKPLLRLSGIPGKQVLEHIITGEIVSLPTPADGSSWHLAESNGWGYTKADRESTWANDVLQTTLWKSDGDLYLETQSNEGREPVTVWLDDALKRFTTSFLSWQAGPGYQVVPRLSMVKSAVPRGGAIHFFNLADVQAAASFTSKLPKSARWIARSMPRWLELCATFGIPSLHFLDPVSGTDSISLRVAGTHVSSYALVVVLLNGSANMKDAYDRGRCMDVLRGFFKVVVGDGHLFLQPHRRTTAANIYGDGDVILEVRNGMFHGNASAIMEPDIKKILGTDVITTLHALFASPTSPNWLVREIIFGLGFLCEHKCTDSEWPTDPLLCLTRQGTRTRADRCVRQAIGDLEMKEVRNQHRAGKFLAVLGFKNLSHRSGLDAEYMGRYLASLRAESDEQWSFAISGDKSRGSGRDWISGTVTPYNCRIGCGNGAQGENY